MPSPDYELTRELYARFGLAYYQSECLHRNLCMAYALAPFALPDGITGPRVDERMAEAFGMTLGQVVDALRPWTSPVLQASLEEASERRNALAHRFWFERIHLAFTEEGIHELIENLNADTTFFTSVDEEAEAHFAEQSERVGVTKNATQVALAELLQHPTKQLSS